MVMPPKIKSKLTPPADNEPTLNMTGKSSQPDGTVKPIQIKITMVKHKEIKTYAAEQGITITELLLAGYDMYRSKMN